MTSYKGAQAHYLSPQRRDPVKRIVEEPVSRDVLRGALADLRPPTRSPLRVLDLGSGIGDGLDLLTGADGTDSVVVPARSLDYVGLDSDPDMVRTASSRQVGTHAAFVQGDMRDRLPEGPFDLYMSCGVPYSHLTVEETTELLTRIFGDVAASGRRSAVLVDVLGRFSIEWTPRWAQRRWNYAMTFLQGTEERIESPMTFYGRDDLAELVVEAAHAADVTLSALRFTDRSVLSGRHTATRTFNPAIPPYRQLLNDLAEGVIDVPAERLRFQPPASPDAPTEIGDFFRALGDRWNAEIDRAMTPHPRGETVPAAEGPDLARTLFRCEREMQRGLGAGHSMTATAIIEPS